MSTWVGTSWKMNKTLAEGLAFAEALAAFVPGLDDRVQPFVIPSFTAVREVKRGALRHPRQGRRPEHALGRRRRLDRRGLAAPAPRLRPRPRRARPLRAPRALRRDRRDRRPQDRGGRPPRLRAADLRRRDPRRARGRPRRRGPDRPDRGARWPSSTPARRPREILLAYEPVWAIGDKGIPASADYADRQQALIKRAAAEVLGREPQVLYGGSVNPGNAAELVAQPHIDGLFIGRSAWAAEGYIDILKRVVAAL